MVVTPWYVCGVLVRSVCACASDRGSGERSDRNTVGRNSEALRLSPPLRGEDSAPKVSRSTSRTGHLHVYIACRAHTLARATSCSRHPSRVESFYAVELLQHPKVRALDGLAVRGRRGFRFR